MFYYLWLTAARCSLFFFFLMIRRPPRSTLDRSSAASDVYKRQRVTPPSALPSLRICNFFSLLNRDGIRRRFPCATCLGNRVHPSVDKTRLTPLRHIRRTCILTGDSYTAGKPGAHRLLVPFTRQGDGGNARTFVLGRM